MSTPFLSEIRVVSFNFPPKGWALCNGQLLPIAQNQPLFSLLGTTYGGDGRVNFALPNLRGRVPIHVGAGHTLGEAAGSTAVTITPQTMPAHNHFVNAHNQNALQSFAGVAPGTTKSVARAIASLQGGGTAPVQIYGTGTLDRTMRADALTNAGGSQPHNNMMPYLTLNFVIALQGVFPSPN